MKRIVFLGAIVCGLLLASCDKRLYWEDMQPNRLYPISRKVEMKIQPDDRLRIWVYSQNPDLSAPFNLGVTGYQVIDGMLKTNEGIEPGYTVDSDGNIDFPVLGMLHVEGLTLQELSNQIKETLRRGRMINDAFVTVAFLNLKIYVIGAVNGPGILSVQEDKLTLLDAILMSGGLANTADMRDVRVIREGPDGRRMMVNDVRTVKMFNSPSFYLQQNDIVYVMPKIAPVTPIETRTFQLLSLVLGLFGSLATLIIVFNYYK